MDAANLRQRAGPRGGVQTGLSEDASSVVESRGATVEAVRPPRVPV
jgi:hypothetical protein